jgi:hypothetical protein
MRYGVSVLAAFGDGIAFMFGTKITTITFGR